MLIQDSDIIQENDFMDLIDNLEYITESESSYPAVMVPIQYNSRLDKDLVHLEDFVRYADCNDIDDGGYALASVCEANGISTSNIGFMVNEASIYADDDIYNTAKMLRENAYVVAISPVSDESTYYRELEEALEMDDNCNTFETSPNLMAYCEVFDNIRNSVSNGIDKAKDYVGNAYDSAKQKASDISSKISNTVSNAVTSVGNRVKRNVGNIKSFASGSINKLSNKLAAIRKAIGNNVSKLGRAAGNVKAGIQNRISKLKDAASNVWNKIVALKNRAADGISNAASTVKNKASNAVDYVKSKF